MVQEALVSISIILVTATIVTVLARYIRQPTIIAYLITGIIIGPLFFNILGHGGQTNALVQTFAHIGVAFLLFIVGLNLDLRVLKEVGKVSVFAGVAEIVLTGGIGFLIAIGLGFQNVAALYIAAALAFSSTVVIVKILSDKKEIDTLHGRIALGILIIEDFVAALVLMIIPFMQHQATNITLYTQLGLILGVTGLIFLIALFILPKLMDQLARNQEVLFLFGVAWALTIATFFDYMGFSLEIGALIAGMALASSKYTIELGGKIKPLRDFFIVLFFVFFGSQLAGTISWKLVGEALLFSAFIIVGKPIIVMTVLRMFGYKKRTNFLTGSSLAQISEFSLIIALLGFTLGHLSQEIMSLAVLIAVITIGISSYSIYYSHNIFKRIERLLTIFENKKHRHEIETKEKNDFEIVLFGYHRTGFKILRALKKLKTPFIVIDYNPKVILALRKEGINCMYGDAADPYFLNELRLDKTKLIISTIPDTNSNLTIQEHLKAIHHKATFIATCDVPRSAIDLYKQGIQYVIIPHHLGGEYVADMILKHGLHRDPYERIGEQHYTELKKSKEESQYGM